MKFQKGHKFAKGGKRPGAGRPTKQKIECKQLAAELVRGYVEGHIEPVVETYMALASGRIVERMTPEGIKKFEILVDPATTRHAIDKFLPAIKQELEISGGLKIVKIDSWQPDDA